MEYVPASAGHDAGEDLQDVVSAISHDLQAPVRHVQAFLAELQHEIDETQLSDDARGFIARTTAAADVLEARLAALRTYARVVSTAAMATACDVEQIVAGVVDAKRDDLALLGVAVTTGPLPIVQADPAQLTAVFDELITNSMRFGGDRLSVITVEARTVGNEHVFEVADDGRGIDNRHTATVFKLYRRCHDASIAGAGMGLASVRRIVERHGGWIRFDSDLDAGSTMRFSIPVEPVGPGDR